MYEMLQTLKPGPRGLKYIMYSYTLSQIWVMNPSYHLDWTYAYTWARLKSPRLCEAYTFGNAQKNFFFFLQKPNITCYLYFSLYL
jgi:hypothetical protein